MRRLAEAALAVAKYSSEGSQVEAVLLSGLAGELQEQFDLEDSAAFNAAEHLAQVARERHALWFRHAL
ncbi:hypothetical protein F0U62_33960 [Cystobacter fuscus]|uniref:hypothetical protein n=1 Tax=Cystobacter fuscus TaxID=43 RepID=UPI002B2BE03F|nr:hypothetical protein F0U62_33960 [Cystobacter fuscus]